VAWNDGYGTGQGQVVGSCEGGDEFLGCMEMRVI
jgi:hypothetical protein